MHLCWHRSKLFVSIICVFGLISCGKVNPTSNNVFKYILPSSVTSLDPAFARNQSNIWVVSHLYNTLVSLDSNMLIQPSLAKSWSISQDGLKYTFVLRSRVGWHENKNLPELDKRSLIATDVVYSFLRLSDPQINSPGSWIFTGKMDTIQPFVALNDSVLVCNLKQPFRPFLSLLTSAYCSIVPKEAVEFYKDDFRTHPVGTGPFQFKKWIESQTIFLSKNTTYFQNSPGNAVPAVDGIRIDFVPDRMTAFLYFLRGKTDFINGIESSFAKSLLNANGELQTKWRSKINLVKNDFLNTEFIGINASSLPNGHPLKNKYFRQALDASVDKATLIRLLRFNNGTPAYNGIVPMGLPLFNPFSYRFFDLQKARSLLIKSGFYDPKKIPELILHCNKEYVDVCTFVARQWQLLGVPVRIELVENATLREMMRNNKTYLFRASWIADYPDEENFYTLFYSKNSAPPNYTRFSNAEYDRLYELSTASNDKELIKKYYNRMNEIISDECPIIPLWYDKSIHFLSPRVKKWDSNAMNIPNMEKAELFNGK